MYIFGGFSGLLLNDVLAYTPPSCPAWADPDACAAAGPGVRCHWVKGQCVPWEPHLAADVVPAPFCPLRPGTLAGHPAPGASLSPLLLALLSPSIQALLY